jgi:hypothetical protein
VERTWAKRAYSESWYGEGRDSPSSAFGLDANISKTVDPSVVGDGESIEVVYANKLKSYTGSAAAPIGQVVEESHVVDGISNSLAVVLTETTTVATAHTETETSPVHDEWSLGGVHSEFELTALHAEFELGALHTEFSLSGIHAEVELSGLHFQLEAGLTLLELTFSPFHFELECSSHSEYSFGEHWEYKTKLKELHAFKESWFVVKKKTGVSSTTTSVSHTVTSPSVRLGVP